MATKPKARKWVSPDYRRHLAEHARNMRLKAPLKNAMHDPIYSDQPTRHQRDAVLYAAALGQKRGELPADLSGFDATFRELSDGNGAVTFRGKDKKNHNRHALFELDASAPGLRI